MTVLEYLNQNGYKFQVKGKEAILDLCPFCKHENSKNRFLVNLETGAYICNRQSSCGAKGYFKLDNVESKTVTALDDNSKKIVLKSTDFEPMTNSMISYLNKRGISYETARKARVLSNKKGALCFFYTNRAGGLIGVKYRTIPKDGEKKKIWAEPGSVMSLLNWDKVPKDSTRLYITEGEIDMLSLMEIGYENVVSVPNGTKSQEWIEIHYEWLQKFKEIVLIMDNDKAGEVALKTISDRLQGEKCKIFRVDLMFYKDPNEVLSDEQGQIKLKNILENRIEEIEEFELLDIAEVNGNINQEAKDWGDRAFNALTGGKRKGEVILITGNPGSGKSAFLNMLMCNIIDIGEKVYTMQGEFTPNKFKQNIMKILCRPSHIETVKNIFKDKIYGKVSKPVEEKINLWLKNKLYIHKNQVPKKDELLKSMHSAYKKYGVENFFIDNLMTINLEGNSSDKYDKQRDLFIELQEFAKSKQVTIAVVAHPRKNSIVNLEDADMGVVSGASEIINLANYAIFLKRLTEKEEEFLREKGIKASVGAKNLKDREFGDINLKAYWNYEIKTGRFLDVKDPEKSKNKMYGWETDSPVNLKIQALPFE